MALPTPPMQSCCKKQRCLFGINIGEVYDVCDPCQGTGYFDADKCDCIDCRNPTDVGVIYCYKTAMSGYTLVRYYGDGTYIGVSSSNSIYVEVTNVWKPNSYQMAFSYVDVYGGTGTRTYNSSLYEWLGFDSVPDSQCLAYAAPKEACP